MRAMPRDPLPKIWYADAEILSRTNVYAGAQLFLKSRV
jgi:hypothetical protein